MAKNPLYELTEQGTSVWLDNMRRSLVTSGQLQRMIDEDALQGMTSNPTIFEKAIGGSSDYDDTIRKLIAEGKSGEELMLDLVVEDIQLAADVMKPVYDRTQRKDGYISIEVLPRVANDTDATVAMAHDLFKRVGRPNIFVKIPATPEGLPAIERCIGDGLNINITLLFSVKVYEKVARAYIRGLQRRLHEGKPVDMASVASFFVSRVDSKVDAALEERIRAASTDQEKQRLQRLLGKAAIANAKLAYQVFKKVFGEPEFEELRREGARVQRCLWASTSTKNPHYSDVLYVEELIGPETVNTMPDQTLKAFREHGEVRPSLEENVDAARQLMRELDALGIDMEKVTYELEVEGVKAFGESVTKLLEELEEKVRRLQDGGAGPHETRPLGSLARPVQMRLESLQRDRAVQRLWDREPALWKPDRAGQGEIADRLGWLDVLERMEDCVPDLQRLTSELLSEGYRHAVLLGMGGSSLAPEVFHRTFGTAAEALELHVLDTTDPGAIQALQSSIAIDKTVFLVASKSGTTLETQSHYHYFFEKTGRRGDRFIAITDPGTALATEAEQRGFRRLFKNPPDIGGRYSALSFFGLVPAALAGIDIGRLLDRAATMMHACVPSVPTSANPGAWLGAVFAEAARAGRDKVTILAGEPLESFGLWAEQLIAESTGKEGRGLIPVAGESVGEPNVYATDRLFVRLLVEGGRDAQAVSVEALQAAGQPVVTLSLRDPIDLGAEFYRWEFAVAVAGAILQLNVFDQPNVQEAKDLTRSILQGSRPPATGQGIRWAGQSGSSLEAALKTLLDQAKPSDYVALLAYVPPTASTDRALQAIRLAIRDGHRVATTVGYGPRYLHSTGQLHKGGPNTGVFLQIVGDDASDLPIPGADYTFGVLKHAQALADYQALRSHGRRVLSVQLPDVDGGLSRIAQAVGATIEAR